MMPDAYDLLDRLTKMTENIGAETTIGYDAMGRKTQMTTPDGGTVRYGYDEYGKMKTLTSALGQVTGYEYDTLHRLAAMVYPGAGGRVDYAYGTSGLERGHLVLERGPGYTNEYTYNKYGEIATQLFYTGSIK